MRISAIVPTLREARRIAAIVATLQEEVDEVVVADGGSDDGTGERALAIGARVVQSAPGRGPQLNAGAATATGDILWFVHADTRVPPGSGCALRRAAEAAPWGCFDVRVDSRDPRLRWAGRWMGGRAKLTGSATGDMAIWAKRSFFEALGGYAPLPALEDLDFTERARKLARGAVVPVRVGTSARRWEEEGVTRTMGRMWAIRLAWRLGWDAEELATWYRSQPR